MRRLYVVHLISALVDGSYIPKFYKKNAHSMEFASVTGASSGRTYMALWNTLHYNPLKSLNTL